MEPTKPDSIRTDLDWMQRVIESSPESVISMDVSDVENMMAEIAQMRIIVSAAEGAGIEWRDPGTWEAWDKANEVLAETLERFGYLGGLDEEDDV
jgi:hypothetical protein